ncbi:hypothetical protein BCR33DRAFT_267763 [Rhizoclosmatium globosum]|uniref:Uncharacterized protein n=1 Tax=Rhizoclosmatium globosum TaxID=329046 RepID=A0A1Y2AC10_9FUNG|nr:hypothetical protein BCR33DRAFT_267763 [Rhizoclosmatium globosum]|eukprot:ORY20042.1 hypothetical protein BCR33DRAFT_267763 [Rhizoclosmatium globosum]
MQPNIFVITDLSEVDYYIVNRKLSTKHKSSPLSKQPARWGVLVEQKGKRSKLFDNIHYPVQYIRKAQESCCFFNG